MNIFVSDLDPIVAAQNLDDKRVVKMALESAQILSTIGLGRYKPTHVNHPCTKWAGASPSNTLWLFRHFHALCTEYYYRFNREHASLCAISYFVPKTLPPSPSSFMLCPGGNLTLNPTRFYQELLKHKWLHDKRPPKWTKRCSPGWYPIFTA
jgi:hypothetical protein